MKMLPVFYVSDRQSPTVYVNIASAIFIVYQYASIGGYVMYFWIFPFTLLFSTFEEILLHSPGGDHVVLSSPKVLLMRSLLYRMTWPARCVMVEPIPDPPSWKGAIH